MLVKFFNLLVIETYLFDHLANRLNLLQSLAQDVAHALSELAVLLSLSGGFLLLLSRAFLGLLFGLGKVLDKSAFTNAVTIVVNDIAVIINALADEGSKVAVG